MGARNARAVAVRRRAFWSVTLGMRAVRVSAFDEHGGEIFSVVGQGGTGRENREKRQAAEDAVIDAVLRGDEPGCVTVGEEATV